MRFVLAVLAAATVLFLLGALQFVVLLPEYSRIHFAQIARPPADFSLLGVIVEKLLQAACLVMLYQMVLPTRHSFAVTAKFGAIVAVLLEGSWVLGTWNSYPLEFMPLLILGVLAALRLMAACLTVGLIYSRRPPTGDVS